MIDKDNYLVDKKNGLLERLRGDEISRRIAQETPLSAQVALIMDVLDAVVVVLADEFEGKDSKAEEWKTYQALRQKVKAEVDADMEARERTILEEKKENTDEA